MIARPTIKAAAAAAAFALGASIAIERAGQLRVDALAAGAAQLDLQLAADDALTARRDALAARRAQLRTQLAGILDAAGATQRTAAFVRETARFAGLHHARVASIVPGVAAAVSTPAPARPGFDVAFEGEYADVLATIAALSSLSYPMEIRVTSIVRKNPHAAATTVLAVVHATPASTTGDGA